MRPEELGSETGCKSHLTTSWVFTGGSVVKNLSTVRETQETWIQSLGQEDLLEKEMAPHSRILIWEIPWTEEPGGLQYKIVR